MYLLFAGNDFYPGGGWRDYIQTFYSIEEFLEYKKNNMYEENMLGIEPKYDWWELVDFETKEVILDQKSP